ncbi:hypothetical protein [Flavobacterium pectinovorum]|uniref:Uncharacterized protein n=1 Tax=Flavobacterium pectinovorum TaxID=29533 RepID=A0A502EG11_9FLAO|nr:hypothetical protein [Flavobacterium pectinovorum]TPG36144.1 hypothetical protein EAH81_20190 [Flavobacterium pectinovorum]
MIPDKPQKKVVERIGETFPYLFENADKIIFNQSYTEIPLLKSFESFEKENFSDLLRILCTLGSLNLANEIKTDEKNYFLGEKLRIRKISNTKSSGLLTAKVTPQLENDQKGKSIIDIMDGTTKLFQMEMDYFIIDETSFKRIFESHYHAENTDDFTTSLPNTSIEYLSESEFNITVDEFTRNHCSGHFDNYQIVPGVFIGKCILKNIFKFSADIDLEIDNLELFLNKAMPINTVFNVNVKIMHLSKNLRNYKCTVTDNTTQYGYYFITFKN